MADREFDLGGYEVFWALTRVIDSLGKLDDPNLPDVNRGLMYALLAARAMCRGDNDMTYWVHAAAETFSKVEGNRAAHTSLLLGDD
mgnify:CR=1 FL=1